MKKFLLWSIILCLLCGTTLLIIGLTQRAPENPIINNPAFTQPSIPNRTEPQKPFETMEVGTYYLIAGTNVNHYLQESDLEACLQHEFLSLSFDNTGECVMKYNGLHYTEYSERAGVLYLSETTVLTDYYPFTVEHSDEWLAQWNPSYHETISLRYDNSTQIITVCYGMDSMEFKYFPTAQDAATWILQYVPSGGGIDMPYYSQQYEIIKQMNNT